MVSMSGFPLNHARPLSQAPSGHFSAVAKGKASAKPVRPDRAVTENTAPAAANHSDGLMDVPPSAFSETWPPRGGAVTALGVVRDVARHWRERSQRKRASSPVHKPQSPARKRDSGSKPTGDGESSSPASSSESEPLLQTACKPFGKDGVRLGWQCSSASLGQSLSCESLLVEWSVDGSADWSVHTELEPRFDDGGGAAGVVTIKASQLGSAGPAPSKCWWRIRSSDGATSAAARLGDRGRAGRGARASVEAAISFDAELDTISASRNIIKGRLFQSLLEALRAQGAGHAQMENSVKHLGGSASEFGLNLVQWSMLTLQADALRNLVRIKVADDNDLRTARAGLLLCAEFFRALSALSALRQVDDEYAVLRAIGEGAAA